MSEADDGVLPYDPDEWEGDEFDDDDDDWEEDDEDDPGQDGVM